MTVEEDKYLYQIITPSEDYYNRLVELKEQYPSLTFQNVGYDTLPKGVKDFHSEPIEEITNILKDSLKGFCSFQNFKDRLDGSWVIRVQYKWNFMFTGVGYFDSRHWDPKEHGKH